MVSCTGGRSPVITSSHFRRAFVNAASCAAVIDPTYRMPMQNSPHVVTVNVIGERPGTEATRVLTPGSVPSVHDIVATPLPFVVAVALAAVPPPSVTWNDTVTPGTARPEASRTTTAGFTIWPNAAVADRLPL